jgi:hypothetical protein
VSSDGIVVGDEPLVDGMRISVRLRRDFTVTDSQLLLAAARRTYGELHPDGSADDATMMVTCAADAIFVILEQAGLLGDVVDERLADRASDGLALGGWRAQVTVDELDPLRPGRDCFQTGDVFALPSTAADES